ncbi:MAG: hypothetical protein Q9171_006696 [Xanthocarpia ochracea]
MYGIFIPFWAVLGLCAARPAQDASAPSVSGSTSSGFPREYLPISQNASASLELPFAPGWEHRIKVNPSFIGSGENAFKRGQLVMSLAVKAYQEWRDEANYPVHSATMQRAEALFQDFVYTLSPNLPIAGVWLAPFSLGIAYCWILTWVLRVEDISSGFLTSPIYQDHLGAFRNIGRVEIFNQSDQSDSASSKVLPLFQNLEKTFWANTTLNSVLKPGNQESSALKITWDELERRWFDCLRRVLLHILQRPKSDLVVEELPSDIPSDPERHVKTYEFKETHDSKDFLVLVMYPEFATQRLTWEGLVEQLLLWGTKVSFDHLYKSIAILQDGNTIIVTMRITIDGQLSGDSQNAGDVATA